MVGLCFCMIRTWEKNKDYTPKQKKTQEKFKRVLVFLYTDQKNFNLHNVVKF